MRERESNSRVALRAISEADALCAPLTSIFFRASLSPRNQFRNLISVLVEL
jgi:hypothetical protein